MTTLIENKVYRLQKMVRVRKAPTPNSPCSITDLDGRTKVTYLGVSRWSGSDFLEVAHKGETTWIYLSGNSPESFLQEIPPPGTKTIIPGMMVKLREYRKFYKHVDMQDGKCNPGGLNPGEIMMFLKEENHEWQPDRFTLMVKVLYKDVAGWFPRNFTSEQDHELYELFDIVEEPPDHHEPEHDSNAL